YDDKCKEIRGKLRSKISKEEMNKIREILKDCEDLLHYESELQKMISENKKLIENSQQIIQQITYNIGSINTSRGHTIVGSQIGNSTNFHYQIIKVLETKIEISPK